MTSNKSEHKEHAMRHFSTCPMCDHKYDHIKMLLVQQNAERTGFHVTCPDCQMSVLVFFANGQMGVMSVGMATDLDRSEVRRLLSGDVIMPNDVLQQYEQFQAVAITMDELLTVAPARAVAKKA